MPAADTNFVWGHVEIPGIVNCYVRRPVRTHGKHRSSRTCAEGTHLGGGRWVV